MTIQPAFLTTAALLATLAATPALANHVDFIRDDSDPSNGVTNATFSLTASNATAVTDTQAGEGADILGGLRQVTLTRAGGFGGTITATKAAGTDFIDVQNSSVSAGTLVLSYPGILNSDFDTRWDAIDIAIPVLDNAVGDGEINLSLTVASSAGSGTAFFTPGTGLAPGRIEEPGVFRFLFSDPAFAGVDFFDVDGVTATFETAIIGSDFRIGSITREAVPEPTTAALLGGLGLTALRRRRA